MFPELFTLYFMFITHIVQMVEINFAITSGGYIQIIDTVLDEGDPSISEKN